MQPVFSHSPIQGVIFDFGSTLAIARAPWTTLIAEGARALTAALRAAGLDLPPDFAEIWSAMLRFAIQQAERDGIERPIEQTLAMVLTSQGYDEADPAVIQRATDVYFMVEDSLRAAAPGAAQLLATLKNAGYRVAVLSNTIGGRWVQRWIDRYGFRPSLSAAVTSDEIGFRKPRPEAFMLTLERMGLGNPAAAVMVGDTMAHDIVGAQALGMRTVLVTLADDMSYRQDTGITTRTLPVMVADAIVCEPDARIAELMELIPLLERWQNHER